MSQFIRDFIKMRTIYFIRYNIIFLVVTYAIPMLSMVVTYSMIGFKLRRETFIGEATAGQLDVIRGRRKLIPMVTAVTVLFGLCWLPYHVYFIYTYKHSSVTSSKYIQHIYLGFYWLAMSNASFNPIIYALFNKRYVAIAYCIWLKWWRIGDGFKFKFWK